jgi:proliferating cell nuclear antigen PCNA
MEIILENPSLFKKSLEIISDLVLEGTFVIKKDYIELVALNSNNVVMVIFRLLSTNFKKYDVEEDTKISLSLEHLTQVLKSCPDTTPLKIILNDEKTKITLISEGKTKKEFELTLIDFADENLQKVPNLQFPVKVATTSAAFTSAINDLSFLDEGVLFKVENNLFSIEGKTASMSGKIEFDDSTVVDVEDNNGSISCKYSIDYLKKFIKADKIVSNVELSFNEDYPLKVEYKLTDKLLLGFILAPRGED